MAESSPRRKLAVILATDVVGLQYEDGRKRGSNTQES